MIGIALDLFAVIGLLLWLGLALVGAALVVAAIVDCVAD